MTIKVGDKVRSFDFADGEYGRDLEGERANYVEGRVDAVGEVELAGCKRYSITVERDVSGGEEYTDRLGMLIHPPLNGTRKMGGDVCDGVEVIS
jgi:hypothetical protein